MVAIYIYSRLISLTTATMPLVNSQTCCHTVKPRKKKKGIRQKRHLSIFWGISHQSDLKKILVFSKSPEIYNIIFQRIRELYHSVTQIQKSISLSLWLCRRLKKDDSKEVRCIEPYSIKALNSAQNDFILSCQYVQLNVTITLRITR